ncbi:hypothetical protein KSS87_003145, partial [Heliosperma pusillum]
KTIICPLSLVLINTANNISLLLLVVGSLSRNAHSIIQIFISFLPLPFKVTSMPFFLFSKKGSTSKGQTEFVS